MWRPGLQAHVQTGRMFKMLQRDYTIIVVIANYFLCHYSYASTTISETSNARERITITCNNRSFA